MKGPFFDYKIQEELDSVQSSCFVEPAHLDRLFDNYHTTFIFGERGSGKTTILKHLERKMNQENHTDWIAFYYRFETATMKSLYNVRLDEDSNIFNFQQAMSAIFMKQLCTKLIDRKGKHEWKEEANICKSIQNLIRVSGNSKINNFEDVYNLMETIRVDTLFNIRSKRADMYMDFNSMLDVFIRALRRESNMSNVRLCILLDEYENLLPMQQRVINSMVKDATDTICYKICLRPEGFWTRQTVAEREYLKENDDYLSIQYVQDIMGSDIEIQELVRKICYNRLKLFFDGQEIYYTEDKLRIDNYLETLTLKGELEKLDNIDEYRKRLLIEINNKLMLSDEKRKSQLESIRDILDLQICSIMLEKGKKFEEIYNAIQKQSEVYVNWKHNYQMNAAYIIFEECGQKRKFSSLDIIIRLAGSNMRTILIILAYIFEDYPFECEKIKKIPIIKQDEAINKIAKMSFNQIEFIPVHGMEVKNLIYALGTLFKQYLQDKQAKKFEVNNFTIKVSGALDNDQYGEIKEVLHDAVMWGILLETDSNKIKNLGEYTYENKDYILHPLYSVYFEISYRTKQKTTISDINIKRMLEPMENTAIRRIAKIGNKEIPGQLNLQSWYENINMR